MTNSILPLYKIGKPGKKVVITAGIHGDEISGIYVAKKLIELADKKPINNVQLCIIPVVNWQGFIEKRREWQSNIDLNREGANIFDSTTTLGKIFKPISDELSKIDLYLDLHNFTKASNSNIIYVLEGNDAKAINLINRLISILDFGFPSNFNLKDEPHLVKTIAYQAITKKIPSLVFEFSPLASVKPSELDLISEKIYHGLQTIFSDTSAPKNKVQYYSACLKKYSDKTGIFQAIATPGHFVPKGALLGNFIDIEAKDKIKLVSDQDSYLQHIHTDGIVSYGDELYVLAQKDTTS